MTAGLVSVGLYAPGDDGATASVLIAPAPHWTTDPDASLRQMLRAAEADRRADAGGVLLFRVLFEDPTFELVIDAAQVAELARRAFALRTVVEPAGRTHSRAKDGSPQTYVQFTITGPDLDPDVLTAGVGITPDRVFHMGDPIGRSRLRARQSGWELSSSRAPSLGFGRQLAEVLQRLDSKASAISQVTKQLNAIARFEFVSHFVESAPGLELDVNAVKEIARLGAGVWLDVIHVDRLD